jgi:hypothetical protein
MGDYGFGYAGSFVPPISSGARRSASRDLYELGSLLKDIGDPDYHNIFGKIPLESFPKL